jgi:sugar lactone lactonase YvrE
MSTPAVSDELTFIADTGRKVHCVDTKTGQPYWTHEAAGEFWGSPLLADGKVYIGTRKGNFLVFAATREKTVLGEVNLPRPISATPTAANGSLFVATMNQLFALKQGAQSSPAN